MGNVFEWDSQKARRNVRKHGVTFDEASTVFGDPLAILMPDPDHSEAEQRYVLRATRQERRKRELRPGGSDFGAFRRRYSDRLQSHLVRIGKEGKSPGDVREIERQFQEEMKQDLADLKAELGLASAKALLSKEVALSALILAGSLAAPIAGLTTLASTVRGIGVIPLMRTAVEHRGARREALKRHAMSFLFLATRGRLTVR